MKRAVFVFIAPISRKTLNEAGDNGKLAKTAFNRCRAR
jgi:hypothetical protein